MGTLNKLTDAAVRHAKVGRRGDGGGLILQITSSNARSWIFRYTSPKGKIREMGLGSLQNFSLKEARVLADEARRKVARGLDPLDEKQAARAPVATIPTFAECAEEYANQRGAGWSASYRLAFKRTIELHVPWKDEPVNKVGLDEVLTALGGV